MCHFGTLKEFIMISPSPRITARVDPDTQALLSEAAALSGISSINSFVLSAAIEKAKGIQWPYREGQSSLKGDPRLYTDGKFQTKSGKANLIPVNFYNNNEQPCEEYPFWLNK